MDKSFVQSYADKSPNWGFNGLGYIVYKRTYARPVPDENRTEEWHETIERCIDGADAIGAGYTEDEKERLFDYIFNLKCSFSGRGLWQLGTTLGKKYGDSLTNCWSVAITEPDDFLFLFNELLLGGGVGYSVRRADINELPKIRKDFDITHASTKDAQFIVPDSREGWVELLRQVFRVLFHTDKYTKDLVYSTILVRGKGEPIKGFGGKASGPLPLIDGIEKICAVCDKRRGKKLRSVDVLDICNIIGSIVVSGNVK